MSDLYPTDASILVGNPTQTYMPQKRIYIFWIGLGDYTYELIWQINTIFNKKWHVDINVEVNYYYCITAIIVTSIKCIINAQMSIHAICKLIVKWDIPIETSQLI